MSVRPTVETPQRTHMDGRYTEMVQSAKGHRDEETQRGVSDEAPALFKGRFRVTSTRLPSWDYRSNGYYIVTICTKDRQPFLGEVLDGSVRPSGAGEMVAEEWRGIAVRRRDVSLGEWIVMPNHVHGIVIIHREPAVETPHRTQPLNAVSEYTPLAKRDDPHPIQRGVSTPATPLRLQAGSLGAIVGQFKSRSTKRIWLSGFRDFGWQPRFYDHIIRDDRSLARISQYVIDNPTSWNCHEETPENLWM